jgi:DNA-directed RNA polymerase specialized sigma54-like protein
MATNLKQLQTQKQKLAPKQVLHAKLLQLSTINLEQAVLQELEQNPLLEEIEQVESPEIEEAWGRIN